ncbi:MAG: hypothetical protein ABIJ59_11785 [Pseudomonadota bacterium]
MFKRIVFVLIALLFCQNHFLFAQNNRPNNTYLPYSWDCTYYFRTNGAPNGCGAEAWMTITGDGDTIYAAKGTKKQFITMKFSVEDVLKINELLPDIQRLKIEEKFIMVDFTKHKIQSLAGYINNEVFGLIFLLPEKKNLIKLEGPLENIKKIGFDVRASENLDKKKKMQILQHLQSKIWGIIEKDKNGKINILMQKKGQAALSPVSLEEFIGYGS